VKLKNGGWSFMINQERMVKEFAEMVSIDSLSKKEGKFIKINNY
jgi:hypothetical protein